jgi:hypothetical protein
MSMENPPSDRQLSTTSPLDELEALQLSLDWKLAEGRFEKADSAPMSPEAAFDREWALAMLHHVLTLLCEEQTTAGKAAQFELLRTYLTTEAKEVPYAKVAAQLTVEIGAARVAVHRLRKRYRELLRREVGKTLSDPAMTDEELAVLARAFD